MKIVFFGIPDLGIICLNSLLSAGKEIVAIVPPRPSHQGFEMMKSMAETYNIPLVYFNDSPKNPEFIEKIKRLNADIAVVSAFDHLIPPELISIMPKGFINCHPSLLPAYRGGNPYFHVIANGEKKTGVTIHYMDESFDTGDIIAQWETDISQAETFGTLFCRLNSKTAELLVGVLNKIENGEQLNTIFQDKIGDYPKAPNVKPNSKDVEIDWGKSSLEIERFVRACNPYFGAMTSFRNCPLKIWNGEYSTEKKYNSKTPGTIVEVNKELLIISTGGGLFYPKAVQAGMFVICDIKEFIRRTNPQKGELFSNNLNLF